MEPNSSDITSDRTTPAPLDLAVVGGGPCGIACGIEAGRAGLEYRIFEKGALTDSIRRFPEGMSFFSTPERLEIDQLPFPTTSVRPTREEALQYFRRVVERHHLAISLYTEVTSVRPLDGGGFEVTTSAEVGASESSASYRARNVVLATGYYDWPNRVGVPGEDLPHVSHYYRDPYRYAGTNVVIVGGGNSAVEASLDLFRHGAKVTLVHRGADLKPTVKYWVKPDLDHRIASGEIGARFETEVSAIREREIDLTDSRTQEPVTLAADFVLLLVGYYPSPDLLRGAGVSVPEDSLVPEYDADTHRTPIEGLYVGGSVVSGRQTGRIFIENSRAHAEIIVSDLVRRREGARA